MQTPWQEIADEVNARELYDLLSVAFVAQQKITQEEIEHAQRKNADSN